MRPAAPDQRQHQQVRISSTEISSNSHSARPFSADHHDVHADMAAVALHIGDAHKGNQRHRLLDPVHIARQRRI